MIIGYYIAGIKPSDGGIFQYSVYLLKMLLHCDEIKEVYIFYSPDQKEDFRDFILNPKVRPIIYNNNNRLTRILRRISDFWLARFYIKAHPNHFCKSLYRGINPERRFLNKYDLDILHIPRQHSPAYELRFPVVVTMHDIQHFYFPEFFTPLERIHKAIRYYTTICEADHIIVSFKHIEDDLKKYFKQNANNISVCPVPLNQEWLTDVGTPSSELKLKYNLPDVFILTPAATWEHKNHIAVLEAMNILRGESYYVCWVVTGHKTPFYLEIQKKIDLLQLQNQVIFTGLVSSKDLKGLYNLANLVVIPTLYEAGSGPLFEAMRYAVPVVCSNVTSLPETIGNQEFVFNPLNFHEIAGLIKRGLEDKEFIKKSLENSEIRTKYYMNLNYESSFIKAYKETINKFNS